METTTHRFLNTSGLIQLIRYRRTNTARTLKRIAQKISTTRSASTKALSTARISTQADKAVDSFYVSKDSDKVVSSEDCDHIRRELVARIDPA